MSGITRKGQVPVEENLKKRVPPPLADKSYDRHIADNGKALKWMRDAGMLDDGPESREKGPLHVLARAATPDIAEGEIISVARLRRGRRTTARDIAHLYATESQRPAVTGVQKGPDGGVYYTASAGGAGDPFSGGLESDTAPVVGAGLSRDDAGRFLPDERSKENVEDTPLERVKRKRFGKDIGLQHMVKRAR